MSASRPHGAREWLVERAALLVLIPLGLWAAFSFASLAGQGHEAAFAWASSGLNAVLAAILSVAFFLFAALAWKVIIEDYLRGPTMRLALVLNYLICLALALAALTFIVSIALGSTPAGA